MKRATIYLDETLHEALRIKSFETNESISALVGDAIRGAVEADLDDLNAIKARRRKKPVSNSIFLKDLKRRGKI